MKKKVFVRLMYQNQPKNSLQKAIQFQLPQYDHTIIEEPEQLIARLQSMVLDMQKLHFRCHPDTGKMTVHDHPGTNVTIFFTDTKADSAFAGIEFHKIRDTNSPISYESDF